MICSMCISAFNASLDQYHNFDLRRISYLSQEINSGSIGVALLTRRAMLIGCVPFRMVPARRIQLESIFLSSFAKYANLSLYFLR